MSRTLPEVALPHHVQFVKSCQSTCSFHLEAACSRKGSHPLCIREDDHTLCWRLTLRQQRFMSFIQFSHATLVFQIYRTRMCSSQNTHKTISAHASRDIASYASRNVKMILQCSPLQGSTSHHLDIASQEEHPLNSANISRSINCGTPCELQTMSSKSANMQPARGLPLSPPHHRR